MIDLLIILYFADTSFVLILPRKLKLVIELTYIFYYKKVSTLSCVSIQLSFESDNTAWSYHFLNRVVCSCSLLEGINRTE